jgi:hypothetical protein
MFLEKRKRKKWASHHFVFLNKSNIRSLFLFLFPPLLVREKNKFVIIGNILSFFWLVFFLGWPWWPQLGLFTKHKNFTQRFTKLRQTYTPKFFKIKFPVWLVPNSTKTSGCAQKMTTGPRELRKELESVQQGYPATGITNYGTHTRDTRTRTHTHFNNWQEYISEGIYITRLPQKKSREKANRNGGDTSWGMLMRDEKFPTDLVAASSSTLRLQSDTLGVLRNANKRDK